MGSIFLNVFDYVIVIVNTQMVNTEAFFLITCSFRFQNNMLTSAITEGVLQCVNIIKTLSHSINDNIVYVVKTTINQLIFTIKLIKKI